MLFGIVFTEILSVIFMIWDKFFVSIYTVSETVAFYGLIRLHHVCSLEGLTATYEVESAALRGMGKSLEPSIITIRNQKRRWGSCSSKGNLNFNYRLHYLPQELMDYVVVHELAHRLEMNHSARFWNIVGQYDPKYREHQKQLTEIGIN